MLDRVTAALLPASAPGFPPPPFALPTSIAMLPAPLSVLPRCPLSLDSNLLDPTPHSLQDVEHVDRLPPEDRTHMRQVCAAG